MAKMEKNTSRIEDVIVWGIFAACAVAAFVGLESGHKEVIAYAFIALGIFLAVYVFLTFGVSNYRMKARIRKASKRTAAEIF